MEVRSSVLAALITVAAVCALTGCGYNVSAPSPQAPIASVATRSASLPQFKTLYTFPGYTYGGHPRGDIAAIAGTLYGITVLGGDRQGQCTHLGCSVLYAIDVATGSERVVYYFTPSSGEPPVGSGITAVYGNLYGVLPGRAIFKVDPNTGAANVYTLTGLDGWGPNEVIGFQGLLYGTSASGGASGRGNVFTLSPTGQFRTIYTFKHGNDAGNPTGPLVAFGSALYGVSIQGGQNGSGAVFTVTAQGRERVLYSNPRNGRFAGPLVALHGRLYGIVSRLDKSRQDRGFLYDVDATTGHEHDDYKFASGPTSGTLAVIDGDIYGANGATVFRFDPSGTMTIVHRFATEKAGPNAVHAYDGVLYGTTSYGNNVDVLCAYGCGSAWALTP